LHLPPNVVPVAYLCLGHVDAFPVEPELQSAGWLPRLPLADVVHIDTWEGERGADWDELSRVLR
jgi:5,6-dimethylbenzimidazole synthase